jgi:PhnB protein
MTDTIATTSAVRAIPEGYHTVTPSLVVQNAAEAIEFYKRAFGAEELYRMSSPDGQQIWHAEIEIGDSRVMLNDEFPDMGARGPQSIGGTPVSLHLYVEDADAWFRRAIDAGATVSMPLEDTFWGDRYGQVTDPFGHQWALATHKEDMSEEELRRRAETMAAQSS